MMVDVGVVAVAAAVAVAKAVTQARCLASPTEGLASLRTRLLRSSWKRLVAQISRAQVGVDCLYRFVIRPMQLRRSLGICQFQLWPIFRGCRNFSVSDLFQLCTRQILVSSFVIESTYRLVDVESPSVRQIGQDLSLIHI